MGYDVVRGLVDAAMMAGVHQFGLISSMGTEMPEALSPLVATLPVKWSGEPYLERSGLLYDRAPCGLPDEPRSGALLASSLPRMAGSASTRPIAPCATG